MIVAFVTLFLVALIRVLMIMALLVFESVPAAVSFLVVMAVTVIMVVGFVAEAFGSGQTGDRDGIDDVDFGTGGVEHPGHECVVASAVLNHEVGLRQFEAILSGRLIGVRILVRVVDDRADIGEVAGYLGDDIGVDVGRGHHAQCPRVGFGGLSTTAAEDQRRRGGDGSGGEKYARRGHEEPFQGVEVQATSSTILRSEARH